VRAAAAAAGIVLLATVACGSSHRPVQVVAGRVEETAPPCTVRVFLSDSAGRAVKKAVERRALRQLGVRSVVYVSKKVSLGRLSAKYPSMTKSLAYNPLSNEYDVTFDDAVDAVIGAEHLRQSRSSRVLEPSDCPPIRQP